MENKDSMNPMERRTKIIYELGADVTFEFRNGDVIKINKSVLGYHTDFLSDVFFGPSPATKFEVKNFDSGTFRTFLDCLFGLKEYSVLDSLLIYPIAHEYQVKESLEKCVEVLKPKVMDENVPVILNLALFYGDDELEKSVIRFIKAEIGAFGFMDANEGYLNSLEPISICRLLEDIALNSYVWKVTYDWAGSYIERNCKSIDILSFLKNVGIFSKIRLEHFESVKILSDFLEIQLLDSNQILQFLFTKSLSLTENIFPTKSEWVKMDKLVTFKESIEFSHPISCSTVEHKNGLVFQISTNVVFFENTKLNIAPELVVNIKYSFRNISSATLKDAVQLSHKNECPSRYYGGNKCTCFVPLQISSFDSRECPEITALVFRHGDLHFETDLHKFENKFQEIKSVEISYTFKDLHNFRILKTTLNGNFKGDEDLYFTRKIVVAPKNCE